MIGSNSCLYSGVCVCVYVCVCACAHMRVLSHVQLCDPMDCSLPDSSAHGIFQASVGMAAHW